MSYVTRKYIFAGGTLDLFGKAQVGLVWGVIDRMWLQGSPNDQKHICSQMPQGGRSLAAFKRTCTEPLGRWRIVWVLDALCIEHGLVFLNLGEGGVERVRLWSLQIYSVFSIFTLSYIFAFSWAPSSIRTLAQGYLSPLTHKHADT